MAASPARSRRKRGGFSRFFRLWCLALALLGLFVLAKLWRALERYEANSPEAAITSFLQGLPDADEEQLLAQSGFALSPYEKPGAYRQALVNLCKEVPSRRDQLRFSKQLSEQEGTVKVLFEGGSLSLSLHRAGAEEPWQVTPPAPSTLCCTLLAPAHLALTVNGAPLPAGQALAARAAEGYEELAEPPQLLEYRLEGLLDLPRVEASLPDGTCWEVELTPPREGETRTQIAAPVPADQQAGLESIARAAAQAYARYISRDADFAQVDAYLWPGTALENTVRTLDTYWYTNHIGSSFENEEFLGGGSLGPDCCWIELKMDYRVDLGYRQSVLPIHYRMYAALREGSWKLVSLESL